MYQYITLYKKRTVFFKNCPKRIQNLYLSLLYTGIYPLSFIPYPLSFTCIFPLSVISSVTCSFFHKLPHEINRRSQSRNHKDCYQTNTAAGQKTYKCCYGIINNS